MKNYYKIPLILLLFAFSICSAQKEKDWKKMDKTEKKAALQIMTSEEKMNLLQSFKQNMMEEELEIPEENKQEFSALYLEYQNSQKNIKNVFKPRKNLENLSDEEAIKELDASFDVGQKLLDNKREYSKKFQKVMKPQQVLEFFENEGRMRAKVRDRNQEVQSRNQEPKFRNENVPSRIRNNQNSREISVPSREVSTPRRETSAPRRENSAPRRR